MNPQQSSQSVGNALSKTDLYNQSNATPKAKPSTQLDLYSFPLKKRPAIPQKSSKRNRPSNSQTINNSLPSISPYTQPIKVNSVRREIDHTKDEITLVKARIHALKEMKNKYESKRQKSIQKMEFIQTVRQRKNFQSLQKLQVKQRQNEQLSELKERARQLREGMKNEINKARETIYLKNYSMAHLQKQKEQQFQSMIEQKEASIRLQKQQKIEKIKEEEQKHQEKLKQFQQSRIKYASDNHVAKYQRELKEKKKKENALKKLRRQQEKWMNEVRGTEIQYEQTEKELQRINPQLRSIDGSRLKMSGVNKVTTNSISKTHASKQNSEEDPGSKTLAV